MNLITIGSDLEECDDLPPSGTRARLILINYKDITRMYVNDEGKIVSIGMNSGTVGYEFNGFRSDVKKSEEVVKRSQSNKRFKHNVGFVIYDRTQIQKSNIRNVIRGRFVAIVENKGQEDDSIEVLGKECGLEIVGGVIRDAHEDGGFFIINLATPDNGIEFERKLPQTLGTSYDDGLSIIEDVLGTVLSEGFDYELDLTLS
jgi:hypothetical protein